jgi:Bifunctional DNA primase/polymerase, N-terminal/Primase C terminal 2 (PriCT-2)
MLKSALGYAKFGFEVFPIPPGTKTSYKSARWSNGRPWGKTTDLAEIKRDFGHWPSANVGIACGPDSGLWVIDVDTLAAHGKDGFASLRAMEARYGPLPETRTAISPTGSKHILLAWPEGVSVRNAADLAGYPGIDVRGEGGMIVAVPSLKPGVGAYKWENNYAIADAPAAWLELVADKTRKAERTPRGEPQANVDLVAAALKLIPNDANTDWEKWNRIGMAVWAATSGHELGLEAFETWSKKNTARYNSQNARDKWDALSTTPITSIGAGTIFYLAREINPDWRKEYEATFADAKPVIKTLSSDISNTVTRAQELLLEAGVQIYQRSGTLVKPVVNPVDAAKNRKTMVAQLQPISAVHLRDLMNQTIRFQRYEQERGWVDCKPPSETAATLLERHATWEFKLINGIISTQTMRPDGSLLLEPGFDEATGLLLVDPPPLPEILEHPTRDDAIAALALLEDLLIEFKFVDDKGVSRAVALSAFITPVVRGAFDVAPMHAARAPVMSSGKSYLWDVAASIANGQKMPVMAAGSTEEETEKRLGAALLAGQPLISIDNISGELKSDALCQIIERPIVEIRILGKSERVRIVTRGVTIYCTGNNVILVGDLTRRVLTTGLDPQMERPELREFKFNPVDKVLASRGEYIAACLTICRAYLMAGRPDKAKPLSSFEGWSDTVRSALTWLGKADPVDSLEAARADDPELSGLRDILIAWADVIGIGAKMRCTTATAISIINAYNISRSDSQWVDFNNAAQAVAGKQRPADAISLGNWLRYKKGRVVDGLRFESNKVGGYSYWWVADTQNSEKPGKCQPAQDEQPAPDAAPDPDIPF